MGPLASLIWPLSRLAWSARSSRRTLVRCWRTVQACRAWGSAVRPGNLGAGASVLDGEPGTALEQAAHDRGVYDGDLADGRAWERPHSRRCARLIRIRSCGRWSRAGWKGSGARSRSLRTCATTVPAARNGMSATTPSTRRLTTAENEAEPAGHPAVGGRWAGGAHKPDWPRTIGPPNPWC
jgi:hypothetical protein